MSYGSEYIAESVFEQEKAIERWEALCIKAELEASHGLWRCKDGRVMNVTEMTTNHIENCIRMLERNNSPFKTIYTRMFSEELERRKR